MYGIIKTIMMALALSGSPVEDTAIYKENPYVGTWEWEQTTVLGRGGKHTTDATTTEMTRQVIITADNKVQVIVDGKITCEGEFIINENEETGGLNYNVKNGCMKGSINITDSGQLQHYVYLGCPSSTSIYNKVK